MTVAVEFLTIEDTRPAFVGLRFFLNRRSVETMGESALPMSDHLPVSVAAAGVFGSRFRAIRLLLANDENKFFDGFRSELDSEFEVVATARTSEEALRRALDHKPDVVLLADWRPDEETATLRRMKALPRPPKVLVLAERDCQEFCLDLLAAGADVCLPKSHFSSQWRSVIRRLALPS